MIQLRILQLAIAAWKTTLEISGKFRPRTWLILAAVHACISGCALWAYLAHTISPAEIPPIAIAEENPVGADLSRYVVITSDSSMSCVVYGHLSGHWRISSGHQHFGVDVANHNPTASVPKAWSLALATSPVDGQPFNVTIAGNNFTRGTRVFFVVDADRAHGKGRSLLARRRAKPDVALTAPCDPPPLLTQQETRVALATHIFEALMALLMVFFYWQQWRLRKSQELLFALQIREIQQRFAEFEKAHLKQGDEESLIIIP